MKFLIVLTIFCLSTWASPSTRLFTTIKELHKDEGRIIQGTPAEPGQFPWQAALQFQTADGGFFCGGSIISDRFILTAGHCSADALSYTISLGITNLNSGSALTVTTKDHITHEGYNYYLNNDIALIKLESPIEFNDRIQPIQLPKRGNAVGANEKVTVSGWGKTSDESNSVSQNLNFVELTTIKNDKCASVYGDQTIISSTLCAVGHPSHSTCNGDSGGPLVQYDSNGVATQVGVVSFVHVQGCASGNPSGYVRTESFLDWIAKHTGLDL